MKRITNNLLRLALSAGLTQRETFVERVATLLTEKMNSDPQMSEHIAQGLMNLTETLKDELLLREMMAQMVDSLKPESDTNDKAESGTGAGAGAGTGAGAGAGTNEKSNAGAESSAGTEAGLADKIEKLNRTITELNELLKTK